MNFLLLILGFVCVANANILSTLLKRKAQLGELASDPPVACQACNDAVKFFNDMLNSPFVEGSLKQLLYTECSKLPADYAPLCNETIAIAFNDILSFITDMDAHLCSDVVHCTNSTKAVKSQATLCHTVDAISAHLSEIVAQMSTVCTQKTLTTEEQKVCAQLFLYDSAIVVRMTENVLQHFVGPQCQLQNTYLHRGSSVKKTKSVGCEACKDAVDVLNTLLKSSLVEEALQSVLLELCKVLPSQYSSGCTTTVTQFIGTIMDFITDMTPHICDLISNCQALTLKALASKESSVCEVFQEIYSELPKLLVDAEKICDQIPDANLSAGCHDFFKNDFQDVVKMAQQVVSKLASEIPFLHCKVSVAKTELVQAKSVGCEACNDLVTIVNTLLQSELVEGGLKDLLKDLCKLLPSNYTDGCTQTVDQFMTQIVKFITDMTNDICTDGFHCTKMLTRESSLCEVFNEIIKNMPQFAKEAEGVCDKITDQSLAAGCHEFFQSQQQWVVKMGDDVVEWLAKEIPFVHCSFNTTTALRRHG